MKSPKSYPVEEACLCKSQIAQKHVGIGKTDRAPMADTDGSGCRERCRRGGGCPCGDRRGKNHCK